MLNIEFVKSMSVLFAALFCCMAVNAQAVNECNASAKVAKSERAIAGSPYWKFTFHVMTTCDASSGSFEYEYRVKGDAGRGKLRTVPSWNAASGRTFSWTDEVSIGADMDAEFSRFIPGTFKSKKVR